MRAFVNIKKIVCWFVPALFLFACNITNQLQSSQKQLYMGSKVQVTGEKRKDVTRPVADYVKQKPNKKFLGLTKLKMRYYFWGNKQDASKLAVFFRDKYGEPPVLLDSAFIESSVKSMKAYLKSIGFYYSEINYEVKIKGVKAWVNYYVNTNKVYHINHYQLYCADKNIYDIIKSAEKDALIVKGRRLNQEALENEQKRISDLLRNHGYFSFNTDYVTFIVDTSLNNYLVNVYANIANKAMYETHRQYYVNQILIQVEPNYVNPPNSKADTIYYNGIQYVPNKYKLNPNVLDRSLLFENQQLYNHQLLNRSYTRLGDLGIFKQINITTKTYQLNDTDRVDYLVKLVPTTKYDYVIEPQAIISDQNNTFTNQSNYGNYGVAAILQFNNRNVFKNAELFKLTFRTSVEAQGTVSGDTWFNATEQSLTANFVIPHLLLLKKYDANPSYLSTRTTFTGAAIYELNSNFERRSFNLGATWQFNKKFATFYLTPVQLSYTKNKINSQELANQVQDNIYLLTMFNNSLVLGSALGFTYTNRLKTKTNRYYFLRWDVIELSGNLPTFLANVFNYPKNENGFYEIFDVNYSQYIKTALDYRYHIKYDQNNTVVHRLFAGVGLPYGNSPYFLPLERRFFIGGANSIRAWFPRSLGPGGFTTSDQIDHSGDIKLEANTEFRFNIYRRWFEGATFVDAGNVWMAKYDADRPDANFAFNRFVSEIALGAGVGLRFNFDFILIRFDFALPLHNPALPKGQRWDVKNINDVWLSNNLNFNFAIGYPF